MSGEGSPGQHVPDGAGLRLVIVAGSWHQRVSEGLIAGAIRLCEAAGAEYVLVRVPGAFELPVACAHYSTDADALVALGVIIRGGTPHFEYVAGAATDGLTRVALDTGTPVGFGLLTCDDEAQALDRAGLPDSHEDKGWEAAHAAIATVRVLTTPTGFVAPTN
ncbi:MAG: 6,7-dimethyl-8-ribityllumazine synthase [Candidatus Nanopelagicales bacterium]